MKVKSPIIAMLLKSEVRGVNQDYIAGCERVFLQDATFFLRHKRLTHAYIAGPIRRRGILAHKHFCEIFYPHGFLDFLDSVHAHLQFPRWFQWLISAAYFCAELWYVGSFMVRERNADTWYVYQHPLVALFFPEKTIVAYQNFTLNLSFLSHFPNRISFMRFTFPSKSLQQEFFSAYPFLRRAQCHVVYNGMETKRFFPRAKRPKKLTFLFASSWQKEKGIDYLPYLIEKLNREFSDRIAFHIAGSIDLWSLSPKEKYRRESNVQDLVRSATRWSNVKFLGKVRYRDMPRMYRSATWCLFPSVWAEPCALVVLESLACGTPVIAFSCGGTKEVVSDAVNGVVVRRIHKEAFYQAVRGVILRHQSSLYQELVTHSRMVGMQFGLTSRYTSLCSFI